MVPQIRIVRNNLLYSRITWVKNLLKFISPYQPRNLAYNPLCHTLATTAAKTETSFYCTLCRYSFYATSLPARPLHGISLVVFLSDVLFLLELISPIYLKQGKKAGPGSNLGSLPIYDARIQVHSERASQQEK